MSNFDWACTSLLSMTTYQGNACVNKQSSQPESESDGSRLVLGILCSGRDHLLLDLLTIENNNLHLTVRRLYPLGTIYH